MKTHQQFMRHIVNWTLENPIENEYKIGAMVVRDGNILGRGRNATNYLPDASAHAEILAIREACIRMRRKHLRGSTLYTTCEPCCMCVGAAAWAGISHIVFGVSTEEMTKSNPLPRSWSLVKCEEVIKLYGWDIQVTRKVLPGLCKQLLKGTVKRAKNTRKHKKTNPA